MRSQWILSGLMLFMVTPMAYGYDRESGNSFAGRSEVIATHGMAATSQPLATQIAIDILKTGGNAIDAAIAANAALGLMEPTGNGIGGDLFAIIWDAKTKKLYGLNASGRSPRSLTREWFIDNGYESIPRRGALPVSVPGTVDGWFEMHQRFGSLPMKEILEPAIDYARDGFPVSESIAWLWKKYETILGDYPAFRETYLPNGRAPAKGEIFKNPRLANTLEKIAEGGRDVFYKGEMAHVIANHVQANGGFLSYEDLLSHHSEWVEPVSTSYRGYDVWELPPNGQGIAALQMLNILEAYDLRSMGFGSADYLHVLTEAKKLAFEDRAKFYADPDFADVPVKELISKEYADRRRKLLNMDKAAMVFPPGDPKLENGDTIYLATADKYGNMVSLIQSNYRGMGSGMVPPGLGFNLQDRGELFSLEEGHANSFEPGKRPFHTIIPAFVTKDGKPWLSFGIMGGPMQPQAHVQILVNLIDFGMNLQEAGDAPRLRHESSSQPTGGQMRDGGVLFLESGIDDQVIMELTQRGHTVSLSAGKFGGYQAIRRDEENGTYIGASESRKDGHAAGY
ncbi:MAG: gamma-glutamyltransferase [Proteobacteria bacterium]|nr:gamma-glutamyltransferase [Pseudomonadota bacterium]